MQVYEVLSDRRDADEEAEARAYEALSDRRDAEETEVSASEAFVQGRSMGAAMAQPPGDGFTGSTLLHTIADAAETMHGSTPMDLDPTTFDELRDLNTRRAGFALAAVIRYGELTGEMHDEVESVITDLASDLRHLADALGIDWWDIEERAERNHDGELRL